MNLALAVPLHSYKRSRTAGMHVERTFDPELVRSIIAHPGIKPYTWEGEGEPPVPMHESIYYLLAKDERYADGAVEDVTFGVVAFIPVNPVTWNPHMAILPQHRGTGTQAMNLAMRWMFENTPCRKLVAHPPAFNSRMIRVFEKCGFKTEGVSPKSFLWHGVMHARILMGADKEKE